MKKLILLIIVGFLIAGGVFLARQKIRPQIEIGKGGEKVIPMKVLLVVAPKDFRDEEYAKPREILEKAGIQIEVASKGVEEASGVLGTRVKIDKQLADVVVEDYDGIIFIGGPGTTVYFNDQEALKLASLAFQKGKILGAICIAPSIFANAGILSGKKATAFSSEQGNLSAKGAIFTEEEVTVDGRLITASGPQAAVRFGEEIRAAIVNLGNP